MNNVRAATKDASTARAAQLKAEAEAEAAAQTAAELQSRVGSMESTHRLDLDRLLRERDNLLERVLRDLKLHTLCNVGYNDFGKTVPTF